ncbi:MAG: DEAD/DEAH box helicase [Verrucomicrobia bacterium]|nr:DEAD/DEAH box helicase [Verrucomicrobiota bacterium]
MAQAPRRNGLSPRHRAPTKYDAHNLVLDRTYGALADLRRELSDSKQAVAERAELLQLFAQCADPQRAWLLLEDYFERLSLSRKDFEAQEWWPRLLAVKGKDRLEQTALLFLRSNRSLPSELIPHANLERFAEIEETEKAEALVKHLENWVLPPRPHHLDSPRASLRVFCDISPVQQSAALHALQVRFTLNRPRSGEKSRSLRELTELPARAAHEQELFSSDDWAFLVWLTEAYAGPKAFRDQLCLTGADLLRWLAQWGQTNRIEQGDGAGFIRFDGQLAGFIPALQNRENTLHLAHEFRLPDGKHHSLANVRFFAGKPAMALVAGTFYLVPDMPPTPLLEGWITQPAVAVSKLSHRLMAHLRKTVTNNGTDWDQLCVVHRAKPRFVFELADETIRLRLMAEGDQTGSIWQWTGHEWQLTESNRKRRTDRTEILDDPRLEPATAWLRRFDWFTPEPGLWVGDANSTFLNAIAEAWPDRPADADYLGNPAFQRVLLSPRQLRPKLQLHGSGIDWLSVSAEWEAEGMRLTAADIQRLQTATGKFVKLPDAGWVRLDAAAVQAAQETMADLGVEGLSALPQKVALLHAAQMEDSSLARFGEKNAQALRQRLAGFNGVKATALPGCVQAELRPYQKSGFDFLCHLTRLKLGGVLADDMGLGKTLQTLAWLAWLREQSKRPKPALVICPASVLHNWEREAHRFTPDLKVLVLASGAARHNLRQQIPQHDLIVTNYALLRRDLDALQKFAFRVIILDEAQFIKNPTAQVTQSVKQLEGDLRLALTGTPLENRLLDLWSIVDFVQPGYLGSQQRFIELYEPKGEDATLGQKVGRRRLAAKIRPFMLRRLKRQVAQDLPDRIEIRRDCELDDPQRKLYLAELRRSREKVMQTIAEKGVAKSKLHVLAALTRLRQICCHPQLVGNDAASGKTETLFELLEPLLAEGQKVLLFSQFVQMLQILEKECSARQIPTHILTGETKHRQEVVQAFQAAPEAAVFLLSLRAAGTGLNLTTASYVVLYDPWWNPAVEAQAIDRSHRIGQTRTVNAYRLIAPGTVEEKIWELQQRKAQTISDVLGEEGFAKSLTKTDLDYLFAEE